jgi:hypothetical protein
LAKDEKTYRCLSPTHEFSGSSWSMVSLGHELVEASVAGNELIYTWSDGRVARCTINRSIGETFTTDNLGIITAVQRQPEQWKMLLKGGRIAPNSSEDR